MAHITTHQSKATKYPFVIDVFADEQGASYRTREEQTKEVLRKHIDNYLDNLNAS